jgi:hypothetical protein
MLRFFFWRVYICKCHLYKNEIESLIHRIHSWWKMNTRICNWWLDGWGLNLRLTLSADWKVAVMKNPNGIGLIYFPPCNGSSDFVQATLNTCLSPSNVWPNGTLTIMWTSMALFTGGILYICKCHLCKNEIESLIHRIHSWWKMNTRICNGWLDGWGLNLRLTLSADWGLFGWKRRNLFIWWCYWWTPKKETQHVKIYNLLQIFNIILNTEISIILHY